jgi:hypothetical protein
MPQRERLLEERVFAAAQEESYPCTPPYLDNCAAVRERAVRQPGLKSMQAAEVSVGDVGGNAPFKEVHAKVFVSFSFGIPKDRGLNGHHRFGFNCVELHLATEDITGFQCLAGIQYLKAD